MSTEVKITTETIKDASTAEIIAKSILQVMGKNYFTLAEMREAFAKLNRYGRRKSWDEIQAYVDYLSIYGFCEVRQPAKIPKTLQYRIRIDIEFRKALYQTIIKQSEQRISEANIHLSLLDTEHLKQAKTQE